MDKKTFAIMLFAALALAACTKDKRIESTDTPDPVAQGQLRLISSIDTPLAEGETLHVWVDDASTDGSLCRDNTLIAGSDGTLTGDQAIYFPSTGNSADIYAIHGNFASADLSDFWGTEQTHTVSRDQNESSGCAVSDLMFCKLTDVPYTQDAVALTFKHMLSKVEVILIEGLGFPEVSKVEILNTRLEAKFTPSKSGNFSVTVSGLTGNNPIQISTALTPAADAQGTDESKKILNEAYIVPQTLKKDTEFIRVTTTGGDELIYTLPDDKTFEPGGRYRFTITISNSLGDKSVEEAEVGDYIMADGTILSYALLADESNLGQNDRLRQKFASNVVGIVFCTGHSGSDNSDYSSSGIGGARCHGYAVALTDVHNDENDRLTWEYGPNQEYDVSVGTSTNEYDWSGYSNSLKFQEFLQRNTSWEMRHFLAAFACESYSNRTIGSDGYDAKGIYDWQQTLSAPKNTSGWFLPSSGQLKYLSTTSSSLSDRIDVLKEYLPSNCIYRSHVKWLGSSWHYWSSSEVSGAPDSAWSVDISTGNSKSDHKRIPNDVRAILAF